MKEIVTAINNPILNEELKKENNIEIIGKDIQYKEGIIELLEKNKNIDIIIINEKLPGYIEDEELINKIRYINEKIKIIYILEKENSEIERKLKKININDIYFNNKITIKEIIKIIKNNEKNKEEEMRQEIEKLKKIIQEKENKEKNKIKKNNKKLIKKNKKIKHKKEKTNKLINIIGNKNYEKLTIVILLGDILKKNKKNILFIDLSSEKELSKKLLNNYYKKNKNIKKLNINKKIKLNKNKLKLKNKLIKKYKNKNINLTKKFLKIFLKERNKSKKIKRKINLNKKNINKINFFKKTKKEIIKVKEKIFLLNKYNEKNLLKKVNINEKFFDYIIVYLSNEYKNEMVKRLLKKSNKNIIINNANPLGIKQLQRNIEYLLNNKLCSKNSLHIVLYLINNNSLENEIIKNFFKPIKIITFYKDYKEKQKSIKIKIYIKKIEKEFIKIFKS